MDDSNLKDSFVLLLLAALHWTFDVQITPLTVVAWAFANPVYYGLRHAFRAASRKMENG